MLRLSPHTWVAADDIARISIGTNFATATTKDGTKLVVERDNGVDIQTTVERLILKIEHATTTMRVNAEGYAVAPVARWHYPAAGEPAPHGAHVQLLTIGGKQVDGIWRDSGSFIAWAPQLKRDKELEARLKLL